LAAGPDVFSKNWQIGRLREYTFGKAAEPAYAALKPLFRQAAGHLVEDADRLPQKYNRTAYALAANYYNGAGDYAQAIDTIRRLVRDAVKDGEYAPDKIDGDKWNFPAELLADSYHGLGQYELELPLMLKLHARDPKVGVYIRRLAEIHRALGQEQVADRWLDRAEPARTMVGRTAPDFRLPAAAGNGAELTPKELLNGKKALLVNFWFYACGPCRAEAPHLQALYRDLKDKGLEVVSIDLGDTPQNVAKFIDQYKLTFPVALGGKTRDDKSDVFSRFSVTGYPTNYLLDASGKIVWYNTGYDDDSDAFDRLKSELAKLGVKE
jgi:thiol-disulfide isomerase/thioredoxin